MIRRKSLIWLYATVFLLTQLIVGSPAFAQSGTGRIAGDDRYQTAVSISQKGWKSSDYAILARGDNFADALCAGPLAQKYDAPILLTQPNQLNNDTLNELKRLGVKDLFITGGVGAVSQSAEDSLKANGIANIERISGDNRFETAIKIAEKVGNSGKVVLATSNDFPDAMSITVVAAKLGMPILLTGKDDLPDSVQNYLSAQSVSETYIVGGTGAISSEIENYVPGPVRLAGDNRYETNTAIIKHFENILNFENIFVSQGNEFADTLTGAVLAARTSSPLILTGQILPADTANYLKTKLLLSSKVTGLGGQSSIPSSVLSEIITYKEQIQVAEKYSVAGTYGPETGKATISGSVTISAEDVTLRNTIIEGDLLLAQSIGDGNVYLKDVTVRGKTIVNGGGPNSVIMYNFNGETVIVDVPEGSNVRLVAQGNTSITDVSMETNGTLEEFELTGTGFTNVAIPAGAQVTLSGTFGQVDIEASGANVNVASGSITTMNISENAAGAGVNLESGVSVSTLNANAPSSVSGQGKITKANINTSNVSIEQKPNSTTVADGFTADVGGKQETGSTTPSQGSSGSSGGSRGNSGGSSKVNVNSINAIIGTAKVGVELTAGTLTPAGATVSYQWKICDTVDGTYTNIPGATTSRYTPVETDTNKFIKVSATGTGSYIGTVTSAATSAVTIEEFTPAEYFDFDSATGTITDYYPAGLTGTLSQVLDPVIPSKIGGVAVTIIGEAVFDDLKQTIDSQLTSVKLTSVIIPDSVEIIGNDAFYANELTSIIIPDNVISIGAGAFRGNELESITIGSSVETIGDDAFVENWLTNIEIPGSVKIIGKGAFKDTGLESVTMESGIETIGDLAFAGNWLTGIELPNSVTSIGDYAFVGNDLASIEIPDSVETIGLGAFQANELLTVTIGNSVTSIGDYAFEQNYINSAAIGISVQIIGEYAFANNNLTSLIITDSVTSIGKEAFYANELVMVTIGSGVTIGNNLLGDDDAFRVAYGTEGEGTYYKNAGVWGKTFTAVTGIDITGADTVVNGQTLQLGATIEPVNATINTVTWSVESGPGTINGNGLLTTTGVGTVTVNATAQDGSDVVGTTVIEVIEAIPVAAINAIIGTAQVGVELTAGELTPVDATVSYQWKICDTVDGTYTDIEVATTNKYEPVAGDEGKYIKVVATGTDSYSGIVTSTATAAIEASTLAPAEYFTFDSETGTITDYDTNGGLDVVIPSTIGGVSVTGIGNNAFQGKELVSVEIPNSVETIGDSAFFDNKLASVIIGNNVTTIGNGAFQRNNLVRVEIPDSVTSIGNYVFYDNLLNEVIIGNSVESIGEGAFGSNYLEEVAIPNSVKIIGNLAFNYNELDSVIIGNSVTTIGYAAFQGNHLVSIEIPDSVVSIDGAAFSENDLTRIIIGGSVVIGECLLGENDYFSDAYGGEAGTYVGTQTGSWTKQ